MNLSIVNHNSRDIPTEKRNNFILETGKIIVPVDAELFNIGFSSSIDLPIDGNIWVHERCLRWSSTSTDRLNDYEFVRTLVFDALKEVEEVELSPVSQNEYIVAFRNV